MVTRQDLGVWQDDHAEKDLDESSRQDVSVVVRLSRSFWDVVRNVTAAEKLQFLMYLMRQLPLMTVWCRISTLEDTRAATLLI